MRTFRYVPAAPLMLGGFITLSRAGNLEPPLLAERRIESIDRITTLLNVSYDPTRELYEEFHTAFVKYWKDKTGELSPFSNPKAAPVNRPARSSTGWRPPS